MKRTFRINALYDNIINQYTLSEPGLIFNHHTYIEHKMYDRHGKKLKTHTSNMHYMLK